MISHFYFRRKIILCSNPSSLCAQGSLRQSLVSVSLVEMGSSSGLDLVTDSGEKWTILGHPYVVLIFAATRSLVP